MPPGFGARQFGLGDVFEVAAGVQVCPPVGCRPCERVAGSVLMLEADVVAAVSAYHGEAEGPGVRDDGGAGAAHDGHRVAANRYRLTMTSFLGNVGVDVVVLQEDPYPVGPETGPLAVRLDVQVLPRVQRLGE